MANKNNFFRNETPPKATFSNIDMFIADIYFLSANLRDTLMYTMEKYDDSLPNYLARRDRIQMSLRENSPLMTFIKNNNKPNEKGESTGERIQTLLEQFLEEVYSEQSTLFTRDGEKVIFDHAQVARVFEYIVGLHETITDIARGYLKNSQQNNVPTSKDLARLLELGDQFYRSYAYVALLTHLIELFKEFNTAMQESKGEKTAQSNFINSEISRIVTYLRFIKEHCPKSNQEMDGFFKLTDDVIAVMQGESQAPEGKTIWQMFDDARNAAAIYFNQVSPKWSEASATVSRLGKEYLEKQQSKAAS